MYEYLEKLRSKPLHVRRQIHLGATIGLTLLIVVIWGVVTANHIGDALATEKKPESDSPFALFRKDLVAGVQQIKEGVVLLKDKLDE